MSLMPNLEVAAADTIMGGLDPNETGPTEIDPTGALTTGSSEETQQDTGYVGSGEERSTFISSEPGTEPTTDASGFSTQGGTGAQGGQSRYQTEGYEEPESTYGAAVRNPGNMTGGTEMRPTSGGAGSAVGAAAQQKYDYLRDMTERMNEWMQQERERREQERSDVRGQVLDTFKRANRQYRAQIEGIRQQQESRAEQNRGVFGGVDRGG